MKYILSQSLDTAYNLALEEYVLTQLADEDYFILWVSRPAIVVGKFQNVFQEIDVRKAWEKNIPVYRRLSGGGCVYHDAGNLNFSRITGWSMEENTYSRFLESVIRCLCSHGVTAMQSGICNISVDGKKISGNAQSIHKGRLLHHGTLLFNAELATLGGVLCPDYEHFTSKAMRSVPMSVTNLKDCPGFDISDMATLKSCLLKAMGCREGDEYRLSAVQTSEIDRLAQSKYLDWEWNYGKSADFEYENKSEQPKRRIAMTVVGGRIREMELSFAGIPYVVTKAVTNALLGEALKYPEIHGILAGYGDCGRQVETLLFERTTI